MKWRNIKLNQEQKKKLILISVFSIIFIPASIIISKIYLIPMYKNYQIEKIKREKILAKKEEAERIEYEFREFENKFKSLQLVEKIDNPGNPAEIRAEKYYIVKGKDISLAKNVIYSDKFIYISVPEMVKFYIGNGKTVYLFKNYDTIIVNKRNHRNMKIEGSWVFLLDGKLFFKKYKSGKIGGYTQYVTDNYTDIASERKATEQEIKTIDNIEKKLDMSGFGSGFGLISWKIAMEEEKNEKERQKQKENSTDTSNIYYLNYYDCDYKKCLFTKEEMEKLSPSSIESSYGSYYPNSLTQKELEKMEREENQRDRMDSDEWEYEDREEREYWESEEYWGEEGIEKEVY